MKNQAVIIGAIAAIAASGALAHETEFVPYCERDEALPLVEGIGANRQITMDARCGGLSEAGKTAARDCEWIGLSTAVQTLNPIITTSASKRTVTTYWRCVR